MNLYLRIICGALIGWILIAVPVTLLLGLDSSASFMVGEVSGVAGVFIFEWCERKIFARSR